MHTYIRAQVHIKHYTVRLNGIYLHHYSTEESELKKTLEQY